MPAQIPVAHEEITDWLAPLFPVAADRRCRVCVCVCVCVCARRFTTPFRFRQLGFGLVVRLCQSVSYALGLGCTVDSTYACPFSHNLVYSTYACTLAH